MLHAYVYELAPLRMHPGTCMGPEIWIFKYECAYESMDTYKDAFKAMFIYAHVWMKLHVLALGTYEPAWNSAHACASLTIHKCVHPSEHESVYSHVDNLTHTSVQAWPIMCNLLFSYANLGAMMGIGDWEGRGGPAYLPPLGSTALILNIGPCPRPSHHRVYLFSLSGIDLLIDLLNITLGKESNQQLSLIQEKETDWFLGGGSLYPDQLCWYQNGLLDQVSA